MNKKITAILILLGITVTMMSCSIFAWRFPTVRHYRNYTYTPEIDVNLEQDEAYQRYEKIRIKYNSLVRKYKACCKANQESSSQNYDSNDSEETYDEPIYATESNTRRQKVTLIVKGVSSSSVSRIKSVVSENATFDEELVSLNGANLVFTNIFVKTSKGMLLDSIEALSDPTFIFKEIRGDIYDLSATAEVNVTVKGQANPGCTIKIKNKEVLVNDDGYWETKIDIEQGESSVSYEMWCGGEFVKEGTVYVNPGAPGVSNLVPTVYNSSPPSGIDYDAEAEKIMKKYCELKAAYKRCCLNKSETNDSDNNDNNYDSNATSQTERVYSGGTSKKITVILSGVSQSSYDEVLSVIASQGAFLDEDIIYSGNVLTVKDVMVNSTKGSLLDAIESITDPTFIFKELVANYYDLSAEAETEVIVAGNGSPGCSIRILGQEIPIDENGNWSVRLNTSATELEYEMVCNGEVVKTETVRIR